MAVLEANFKRAEEDRKDALERYEALKKRVGEAERRGEEMERKFQPLLAAYEGQIVDRKDFYKMLAGAIVTMLAGLIGIAILSPAIQSLFFHK